VEKRQTTVTYATSPQEVATSFVSAAVSIGLIFLTWSVVSSMLGIETGRNDLGEFAEADYSNYYNYQYTEPAGWYNNYYQGRNFASRAGLLPRAAKMLFNSLDIVETGFRYMDIEDETCRLKTICEMEAYAVGHPLAKLAINTINSSLRGLERYQTAIEAGMNGADCALIYDQCHVSYFGY